MVPETLVNRPRTVWMPRRRTENPTEERAPSMAKVSGSETAWVWSGDAEVVVTAEQREDRPPPGLSAGRGPGDQWTTTEPVMPGCRLHWYPNVPTAGKVRWFEPDE